MSEDHDETILFLHDRALDPKPVLERLLQDVTDTWTIDNKYYTATVSIRTAALDGPIPHAPVVVYLFSDPPPSPLPAVLTRLSVSDPPPDIFLAFCIGGKVTDDDDERFAELGIDVVSEEGEDDDERPMNPFESVRQTLQTHMWPNMVRKAAGSASATAVFPVTFGSDPIPITSTLNGTTKEAETDSDSASASGDPEDTGYTQADDFGDFTEAQARLETWLDDDDAPHSVVARLNQFDDDFGPDPAEHDEEDGARQLASELGGLQGTLDPTPILLHLQAVRAELSLVEDEDERRTRAGEEVARVMRGLGLGEVDFSEFDDDM